jgi:hypothetical protein
MPLVECGVLSCLLALVSPCLCQLEQAQKMRQQIEGLPDGVVKTHMSSALRQLEQEVGITSSPASAPAPQVSRAELITSRRTYLGSWKGEQR